MLECVGMPILAAVPLIDHSVGRARSQISGPARLSEKGVILGPDEVSTWFVYTAPNYAHRLVAAYDCGRKILDRHRHGPETRIRARTTRYPAFRQEFLDLVRRATRNLLTGAITVAISGCFGPPVLERQVLGYDEVTKMLDEKLLLLNIARVSNQEPVHFTSTSSIAATFNWTATLAASGEVTESKGTNFLNLNIGGSASENPTFSISPISGKEFTERVATPFPDTIFEFLVFQGGRIDQVMRLMAAGIEVQTPDGRFVRFIENDPRRPQEYEEFRRMAAPIVCTLSRL